MSVMVFLRLSVQLVTFLLFRSFFGFFYGEFVPFSMFWVKNERLPFFIVPLLWHICKLL